MKINVSANKLNCTKIGFLAFYANYNFKKTTKFWVKYDLDMF